MVQLFLDNKLAVLKAKTNFKFNIDSQMFSQQGGYSFEVTLPLLGCADNLLIFGSLNRCESNIDKVSGSFRLLADSLVYEGDYKITSIDNKDVKIQLLADKTLMNNACKDEFGADIFIDELDLGFFYDEWNWNTKELDYDWPNNFNYPPTEIDDYLDYWRRGLPGMIYWTKERGLEKGIPVNCVLFPITSLVEDKSVNKTGENPWNGPMEFYGKEFAFQPTLVDVLFRVFRALGFELHDEMDWRFSHTYIANTRCKIHVADILPHWTVKEFLTEVSNFFNAIFVYDGKVVTFKKKADFFNDSLQIIDDVVDEFTIDTDDDAEDNFSASGNVDFDWPVEDNLLRLPEEVWERAKVRHFEGPQQINSFVGSLTPEVKKLSQYVLVDDMYKDTFALLQNDASGDFVKSQVNYYPPLLRDPATRDIQTALKIVPARLVLSEGDKKLEMVVDDVITSEDTYNVNDAIKPDAQAESKTTDKRDVMEVFFYDASTFVQTASSIFVTPLAVMICTDETSGLLRRIPFTTQNNFSYRGPYTLESLLASGSSMKIDTKKTFQFRFIKKGPIDINRTFLIKGRRFVCKQLQYDCSADRVKDVILGYFFALD